MYGNGPQIDVFLRGRVANGSDVLTFGCASFSSAVSLQTEAPRGQRPSDLKRVRMDKDDLERLLFRCFEKKAFWGFSELVVRVASRCAPPHRNACLLYVHVAPTLMQTKGIYLIIPPPLAHTRTHTHVFNVYIKGHWGITILQSRRYPRCCTSLDSLGVFGA
jgi:hypothetical protein